MLVLGIDPGTATTGYGLVRDDSGSLVCVASGCILTSPVHDTPQRLEAIYRELTDIIRSEKPDVVAVESLFFNTNAKSALAVGHARGVCLLSCVLAGVPIAEYTPLQVKLAVSGYGRADKKQMKAMVKILLRLDAEPHPDDTADALAVAICHINTSPYLVRVGKGGDRV